MTIDLRNGWDVVDGNAADSFGTTAPAMVPASGVGLAGPETLDYVVRFVTTQGTTLTLDGNQYYALDAFSFGATQTVNLGTAGLTTGKASLNGLTLSLDDAALNPTLFSMLAAGTQFSEVDVLGYQTAGTRGLVVQDSFSLLAGGTLGMNASGEATYVAQYGTVVLGHNSEDASGNPTIADPAGGWNAVSNVAASTLPAVPATLPSSGVAPATPETLDYVVRFIGQKSGTLTLDGNQYYGLDAFSFGATRSTGTTVLNGLTLSLGDAALNPTLLNVFATNQNLSEIDVLGYQTAGTQGLVVQDSFLGNVGSLSVSASGEATFVVQYGTVVLGHDSEDASGNPTIPDPSGGNLAASTLPAVPATLPSSGVAPATPETLDYVVRFVTTQQGTLTLDGNRYYALDAFSFGVAAAYDSTSGLPTGQKYSTGLTLSLGDTALNPTLFQMLAAGTTLRVDVLGYRTSGTQGLAVENSFTRLVGSTLSMNASGEATYVGQYDEMVLGHDSEAANGTTIVDPTGSWNVGTSTLPSAPATLPSSGVAPAAPEALDYVVRFTTHPTTTLTLDGNQYFALDAFSFGATQTVIGLGGLGLTTGTASLNGLTLSLGDAALNPTLFQMLAAGTQFSEVDVLGYQTAGTRGLVVQDSFALVGGSALGIDASGLATYVAQYGAVVLGHHSEDASGNPTIKDTPGGWDAVNNTADNSLPSAPATLPSSGVAPAAPEALDDVVRFITAQGTTLTLGGNQYYALDAFSFGATQNLGRASLNGLTLSLDDAALNPTLFSMLAAGTAFSEVDVLGYQTSGAQGLVLQESFGGVTGSSLAIDASGVTTYVAQYGTLALTHNSEDASGNPTIADPSGGWPASGFGTASPATLPTGSVAAATLVPLEYVARFIVSAGTTLAAGGDTYAALEGVSFGAASSTGTTVLNGLTLSLGQAALDPTLLAMLGAGATFSEVDVLGYQEAGARDLVVDDSFGTVAGGTLSVDASGIATYVAQYGTLSLGIDSQALVAVGAPACFAAGTLIRTEDGEVAVEALQVGERVASAFGGIAPVVWLGHRSVDCRRHPRPWDVQPVRIAPHAFGPGRPHRALLLSPDHAVLVDDALIPVRYLLNGASIAQLDVERITYWHVELAAHDVLLAEGLPAESYLDTGNRGAFENGGAAVHLHPDFALKVWEGEACAPLVMSGPQLAKARAALIARLPLLGWELSRDPCLRFLADGLEAIEPQVLGEWLCLALPDGARTVHIVSRHASPAEFDPQATDWRRLGVALMHLRLDGKAVPLDDPRFLCGWQAPEPGMRWTDGVATLDVAGMAVLELRLAEIPVCYLVHSAPWQSTGTEGAVAGTR